MSHLGGTSLYRPGLQAVRGVAALLVFVQHATWLATNFAEEPTGFLHKFAFGGTGVLLFFTLSGFLMAGQICKPAGRFIVDRARRIYPGLFLAVIVSALVLSSDHYSGWPELTTLLLLPVGTADHIDIPYWTLVYEVQFYIVILLIGRLPSMLHMPIFISWAAYVLYSHFTAPLGMMQAAYPNFYEVSQSLYNLFFIMGILAWHSIKLYKPDQVDGVLSALLLIAVVVVNFFVEASGTLYHFGMLIAAFSVMRYMSSHSPFGLIGHGMARLGNVSYGVYLMHITSSLLAVKILKDLLGMEMGYWAGGACILLVGGSLAYLFGWVEVKTQDFIKIKIYSRKTGGRADSVIVKTSPVDNTAQNIV